MERERDICSHTHTHRGLREGRVSDREPRILGMNVVSSRYKICSKFTGGWWGAIFPRVHQTTCHTGSVPHENDQEMVVTYLSTNSTSSFNRAHLKRRIPLVRDVCARVYVGHILRNGKEGKWLAWKCTLQNVRNC